MFYLPPPVLRCIEQLEAPGHTAWAVGGCVRDSLLGLVPKDYDVATSATPDEVIAAFAGERCLPTGLKHGTVTLLLDDMPIEITTFRTDGEYLDGRRPASVSFSVRVEDDLARRDFTINAMAYSPTRGLCDPFGGRADLADGVLRCVGDPELRLGEDALRTLRALRFAARFGLAIEPATAAALHASAGHLGRIAAERKGGELVQLLCGRADALPGLLLEFSDIISTVIPELAPAVGFEHHNPHHEFTVYGHSVRAVGSVPPQPALRLAALLHDVGKPGCFTQDEHGTGHFYGHAQPGAELAARALTRLRLPRELVEHVAQLVGLHHLPLGSEKQLRRALSKYGEERLRELILLQYADGAAKFSTTDPTAAQRRDERLAALEGMLQREGRITLRELAVDGDILQREGIPPGRQLGEVLGKLLDAVLSGECPNSRAELIALAKIVHSVHNI